jgi:hypothetical protein
MNALSLAILLLVLCASATSAQTGSQPEARPRVRLGPVGLTPGIGLTDLGVDTNVFNEPSNPKRDFTATVTPALDASIHLGRARVAARTRLDLVYFARYAGERSANTRNGVTVDAPLRRLRPYASADWISVRERPGFEIDERSKRREYRLTAGAEIRLGAATSATIDTSRRAIGFDAAEIFDGSYLFEVLNRTQSAVSIGIHRRVTPLTKVTLAVDAERSRFTHSPERDTNSVRVLPRVELAPSALVSGSVALGMRRMQPLSTVTPEFNGLVGATDVSYTLLGMTRVSFHLARDIDYSYDRAWPYYVSTGTAVALRQRIAGPWDVHVSGGRQGLRYVPRRDVFTARLDHVVTLGGGTSYRLGPTTRVVFNVENVRRESEVPGRAYSGVQSGLAIAHDF